jgi:hypothetical protein
MKTVLLTLLMAVHLVPALAQAPATEGTKRLSKEEKILAAVYDDSTRALANLFVSKRSGLTKDRKTGLVIAGASAATFLAGGLLLSNDLNGTEGDNYNPANYAGLGLMLVGAGGVLASGTYAGVKSIQLNPYTYRKYQKVLRLYQDGKPIPAFYRNQMQVPSSY